jgi:hypothetical protein
MVVAALEKQRKRESCVTSGRGMTSGSDVP